MDPWWDDEVIQLATEIRGEMAAATLFEMQQTPQIQDAPIRRIRIGIKKWLQSTK